MQQGQSLLQIEKRQKNQSVTEGCCPNNRQRSAKPKATNLWRPGAAVAPCQEHNTHTCLSCQVPFKKKVLITDKGPIRSPEINGELTWSLSECGSKDLTSGTAIKAESRLLQLPGDQCFGDKAGVCCEPCLVQVCGTGREQQLQPTEPGGSA